MIRAVIPVGADAPHVAAEDQHGDEKEDSCNFEPKGVADAGERAEEPGEAAGETAAGTTGRLACGAGRRPGGGNRLRRLNLAAVLSVSSKPLAGNAARDAHADAEGAAYGFGSHPCL